MPAVPRKPTFPGGAFRQTDVALDPLREVQARRRDQRGERAGADGREQYIHSGDMGARVGKVASASAARHGINDHPRCQLFVRLCPNSYQIVAFCKARHIGSRFQRSA